MILAICMNPAIDVTYTGGLTIGATNRVTSAVRSPGGKAVNTARVLRALGEDVLVTGPAGGDAGARLRRGLDEAGIRHAFVDVSGETRSTVAIVGSGPPTVFVEPGPTITDDEWDAVERRCVDLLDEADAVLISGSAPADAPSELFARILTAARGCHVPSLVDATGPWLRSALRGRPSVTAPNGEEAAAALGVPGSTPVAHLADMLARTTSGLAVVSAGADGLFASGVGIRARIRAPEVDAPNPTGAGDAVNAGLVRGLLGRTSWEDALIEACCLGAAAAASATAGTLEARVLARGLGAAIVEEIE